MNEVNEYEKRASINREEISRLETERKEIELLVRQASLKVFMEERLRNIAAEVEKRVASDTTLSDLLNSYQDVLQRVKGIDGEIERSEKADLIREVLADVSIAPDRKSEPVVITIGGMTINLSPLTDALMAWSRALSHIMNL
jgi:hypothetical protein